MDSFPHFTARAAVLGSPERKVFMDSLHNVLRSTTDIHRYLTHLWSPAMTIDGHST